MSDPARGRFLLMHRIGLAPATFWGEVTTMAIVCSKTGVLIRCHWIAGFSFN
jgi:hypothetical protein